MPISLNRDGDRALVEFDYPNATKNKSKKGDGFYYTFAINGGDKMYVNRHAFMAIDANWCGKNGVMKLERLGEDSYAIEAQSQGENYPLELKQWNTNTNAYDDVPGWIMGQDPEGGTAPPQRQQQQQPQQQPQQAAPQQQAHKQQAQAAAGASWTDLSGTMSHALSLATQIWEHEGPNNPTGDVAGAVERMAVSLYIDARKMGLVAPGKPEASPMQEAVQAVVGAMDGQVEGELVQGGSSAPTVPAYEDSDELPF